MTISELFGSISTRAARLWDLHNGNKFELLRQIFCNICRSLSVLVPRPLSCEANLEPDSFAGLQNGRLRVYLRQSAVGERQNVYCKCDEADVVKNAMIGKLGTGSEIPMRKILLIIVLAGLGGLPFKAACQLAPRSTNVMTASPMSRLATTKINPATAVSLPPISKTSLISSNSKSAVAASIKVFVREGAAWKNVELPTSVEASVVRPRVPPNTAALLAIPVTNKMVLKQG